MQQSRAEQSRAEQSRALSVHNVLLISSTNTIGYIPKPTTYLAVFPQTLHRVSDVVILSLRFKVLSCYHFMLSVTGKEWNKTNKNIKAIPLINMPFSVVVLGIVLDSSRYLLFPQKSRTHARTHTRARTQTHAHTHARAHARRQTHTQAHAQTQARTQTQARAHTHTRTHTHAHTHTHTYTHRNTCAYTHTRARTETRVPTHTHTRAHRNTRAHTHARTGKNSSTKIHSTESKETRELRPDSLLLFSPYSSLFLNDLAFQISHASFCTDTLTELCGLLCFLLPKQEISFTMIQSGII